MKKLFVGCIAISFAAMLAACGDDDSDFATRPSEGSSSSVCEDCDESSSSSESVILSSDSHEGSCSSSTKSSSSGAKSSSSSVTPKSSDSETSVSSSSVKSSSSVAFSSSTKSSSSEKAESSSSKVTEPAEVTAGTMIDSRDGQTYKTVTIGTQTWMAQNLNYETANSYCYADNASYCSKYGRLYTWAAAMDSVGTWSANSKGCGKGKACSPTYPVQGVCPSGWHLPTKAEFETLFTAVGGQSTAGKMLKSTTGWKAYRGIINEDAFAFSALPAGYRNNDGDYSVEGDDAYFWSSTECNSNNAYLMDLNYYFGDAYLDFNYKDYGFSVRCLKD